MPYPPPRYVGDSGEVNATFRPAGTDPELVSALATPAGPRIDQGTSYHYLATSASTGGEFGLYRVEMGPGSGGPALHFHKTMSESFFILSGTMRLFDGESWIDATAGDFLHVPVGGLHAFRNESEGSVSMLMLFAPGAPREAYFEGLTELAELGEVEQAAFFIEHDSYFT